MSEGFQFGRMKSDPDYPNPFPDSESAHDHVMAALQHLDGRLDALERLVRNTQTAAYIAVALALAAALRTCT